MKPTLTCKRCGGSGKEKLPEHLAEVLALFKSPKTKHSAKTASAVVTIDSLNAMNMRLEKLRKIKLLDRTREGRFWMYSAGTGKTDAPKAKPEPTKAKARRAAFRVSSAKK